MRRGRALLPHPEPLRDDTGRWIASRQVVAELIGRHPDMVRKRVPVVACHVPTGCLLVDFDDVERAFGAVPERHWQRKPKD